MTLLKAIRLFDKFVEANTNKDNRDLWIEDENGSKLTWDQFIFSLDDHKDVKKHEYNMNFWSKYGNELLNTAESLPIILDSLYYGQYRTIPLSILTIMLWNLESMWNTHQPTWRDWIEKIFREQKKSEGQQWLRRSHCPSLSNLGFWKIRLSKLCYTKTYDPKNWIQLLCRINEVHTTISEYEAHWQLYWFLTPYQKSYRAANDKIFQKF